MLTVDAEWRSGVTCERQQELKVFEPVLGRIAATLTIACLVHACGGCSRVSESGGDLGSVRPMAAKTIVAEHKPVLPSCPSAPYPMLQASAPEVGHHKVFLSWKASSSAGGSGAANVGYCLYRSQKKSTANVSTKCPDCEQVNLVPVPGTRCVDDVVHDQTTYYYVAVAINSAGRTSSPTKEAVAKIPVAGRKNPAPPDAASYPACRAGN